ncbi:winged helix-turn-helix transcriptional regulator, partial [Leucobacter sp. M11]|uniref:winged helix-turn-helix transcriptional regulator n=1 Tax=Leucobacter sp. M11 TaxID=2993565 RepID=UPI002D7FF663
GEGVPGPIERTLGIVGSRSALLILREAFLGTRRFDDFVRRIGIAPATASAHLRSLVAAGLLRRDPYREPGSRPRQEYRLTDSGLDFLPVISALFRWGQEHVGAHSGLELSHEGCGAEVFPELRCAAGHPVPVSAVLGVA